MSRLPILCLLSLGFLVVSTAGAQTQPIDGQQADVKPVDVFNRVSHLRAELEFIRSEIGRPKDGDLVIQVRNAAPRQVYFQAQTLLRKSGRMCFDYSRTRAPEPQLPGESLQPKHVLAMVDMAAECVGRVKQELNIPESIESAADMEEATPTDVFHSIVRANRQLNLLLDEPFSPSDVYQQVTTAISYCSNLLGEFPGAERIPATPEFERKKSPSDVYQRLVNCVELSLKITELSGYQTLQLEPANLQEIHAAPGDVYDVATLAVSELAYLHSKVDRPRKIHRSYYPGRKFPSHVYQRVGIFEAQLQALVKLVEENPDWLKSQTKATHGKPTKSAE